MATCKPIDMGADVLTFYDQALFRLPPHSRVVEVGVWEGRSVIHLARRIRQWHLLVLVYAVDTFDGGPAATQDMRDYVALHDGSLFEEFQKNVRAADVSDIVVPVKATSVDAARKFVDLSLSLIFIDASHTYEGTAEDIRSWWPKVAPGGLIAGHDYGTYPGVTRAVDEVFPARSLLGSCWSWRK